LGFSIRVRSPIFTVCVSEAELASFPLYVAVMLCAPEVSVEVVKQLPRLRSRLRRDPSGYSEALTFTAAVTSRAGAPQCGETVTFPSR
jgi:hypothetical protein